MPESVIAELRTEDMQRKLKRLIEDPVFFVKTVLKMTPYPYQEEIMLNQSDRRLAVTSRQIGKSTLGQWLAIWWAVTRPNSQVLIISRSQDQSSEFLRDIKGMLLGSPLANDIGNLKSMTKLSLKNNSIIEAMPCSASSLVGRSPDLIILDEASRYESDEVYTEGVRPMLMHKHGKLLIISTPKGKRGFFWNLYNEWQKSEAKAKVWHIPILRQDGTIVCPAFRRKDVDREKREMNDNKFRQEYMGEFIDDTNAFFPYELILPCIKPYKFEHAGNPKKAYYMGVDWGQVQDSTVITIVEKSDNDIVKVVHIKEFESWNYAQILKYIANLLSRFNISRLLVDTQSGGKAQYDELRDRGMPVEGVAFSWQSKAEMFGELRKRFEKKTILIPEHDKLIEELNSFGAEFSKAGRIMLHHQPGAHDDYVDSLVLAVWGATRGNASFGWV